MSHLVHFDADFGSALFVCFTLSLAENSCLTLSGMASASILYIWAPDLSAPAPSCRRTGYRRHRRPLRIRCTDLRYCHADLRFRHHYCEIKRGALTSGERTATLFKAQEE